MQYHVYEEENEWEVCLYWKDRRRESLGPKSWEAYHDRKS